MKKSNLSKAMIASFLGCSALISMAYAATSVNATSSWAVSRVASISQGSYCTMAQKFGDNSILSFARNSSGEYSLALDFQSPAMKAEGEQTFTLQTGNGSKQSFKATPQNPQVVVIGLGQDENFMQGLEKTESLTVSYAGGETEYKLENFKGGRGELAGCMSALKKAPETTASAQEAAEKASSVAPAAESAAEPSVEGLLSARPMPSMGAEPISSTQTSVPVGKVMAEKAAPIPEIVVKTEPAPVAPETPVVDEAQLRKLQDLQVENAQLKKALSDSRREFENAQAEQQGAAVGELQEKLSSSLSENKTLKEKIAALEKSASTPAPVVENKEEMAKLESQIQRMTQQVETLSAENTTLKNQVSIAANSQQKSESGENKDVAALKDQLASVSTENQNLKQQLSIAQNEVVAATQRAQQAAQPVAEDDNSLKKEIRSLKLQIETLEGEKGHLQAEFDKIQKDSESGQLKTVGGNWDLEQATRRYQESQREIRRLGALLEDERLKCTADKKEIEAMLFDPEIAKGAQIAKLDELQAAVSEKDAKITEMQASLAQLQAQASPEKDRQLADLKANLAQLQKNLSDASAEKSKLEGDLAQAKAGAAQQSGMTEKLATAQKDITDRETKIKAMEAQIATLQQASTSATTSVVERDAKIKAMEAQIATLQQVSTSTTTSVAERDAKLVELQGKIAEKDSKLAQLTSQISQLQTEAQQAQLQSQQSQTQGQALQAATVANLQAQVQQGQMQINQLQSQIQTMQQNQAAAAAAAQRASYVQPSYGAEVPKVTPASVSSVPPPRTSMFPSNRDYSSFLQTAGVPVKGALSEVKGGDSESYRAYSWKTDSLYGSVEMKTGASFDTTVSQYLSRAKSRCSGEFAAVPSSITASGAEKSASYEIACVGSGSSSSASILFTLKNGVVSTVAHEGRAEAMEMAIDARDRIARSFR